MSKARLVHYKEKAQNFKKELKYKLNEAAKNTTSHGLPHLLRTKNNILRLMWILFMLASYAYCGYFIIKSIIKYLNYDTVTSIDYLQETSAQFPAITICNRNALMLKDNPILNKIYNDKFDIKDCLNEAWSHEQDDYSLTRKKLRLCYNVSSNLAFHTREMDKIKRYLANENITDKERSSAGYNLDTDMLLSCEFNKLSCNQNNFTHFWSNLYGNCYTFNDGLMQKIYKTSQAGPNFGLVLELFTC